MDLVRLERAVIGYRVPLLPPIDLGVKVGATPGVLEPNGSVTATLQFSAKPGGFTVAVFAGTAPR